MSHAVITLPTAGGEIVISDATTTSMRCGCGLRGGGMAYLTVRADDRTLRMALCGNCLAESLAILFGRRHIEAGGALRDLRRDADGRQN